VSSPYVDHADRHLPGGTDPLPSNAAAAMWPISPQPLLIAGATFFEGLDLTGWTYSAVTADKYGSTKWEASADGDYFIRGLRLGPYGSRWLVAFDVEKGPDCGILAIDAATGLETSPTHGYAVADGLLESPYDTSTTYTQMVNLFSQDCYAAAPGSIQSGDPTSASEFRIKGVDGATLTAFTSYDADLTGTKSADGGAGVWWFRVRVNGKHASSSAYRVTLRGLWLTRVTGDGFVA
jgi:hypothetical protein